MGWGQGTCRTAVSIPVTFMACSPHSRACHIRCPRGVSRWFSISAMAIYHVHFVCAPDYMARRLPFRPAHLKQLAGLRDDGRVVAGGPEPDGTAANIFYRVGRRAELDGILEDNEFN